MKRLFFWLPLLLLSLSVWGQDLRSDRYISAAGHHTYPVPEFRDTPAPKGYKAVYVSHFGRHGSRYQTRSTVYKSVVPLLDTLYQEGLLTPTGDSLRRELALIAEAHVGHEGKLTEVGAREHRGVSQRLHQRVPEVFRQQDARLVHAVSTTVPRCKRSMAEFVGELRREEPGLKYSTGQDTPGRTGHLAVRLPKGVTKNMSEAAKPLRDSLTKAHRRTTMSVLARLTTDPAAVQKVLGKRKPNKFCAELFEAAQGASCLDVQTDPLRFFTLEELHDFMEMRNIGFCQRYGPYEPEWEGRVHAAAPLWQRIVSEADAALAGNGHCADLRFGHDTGLGPSLLLLGVEGFELLPAAKAHLWPAWKYIPMCTNVQMIFYRNKSGDVLVKVLRNENEARIPALKPVSGPYYRWTDFRRYVLERCGAYRPLPAYYNAYLDGKAREITALQKKEATGFFFWTDSHYPDNADNLGPVLEYLQDRIGPVRLFFGGDATLNGPGLNPGLDLLMGTFSQVGGRANFYPVRGNHDFVSNTHEKKPAESMKDAQVTAFMRTFLAPDAVTDTASVKANYYYVDDKSGRIRYIIFDSTDSLKTSGLVVYGIGERQMDWMKREAMATVPKGWSVIVLSHVPFTRNQTKVASHQAAADMIRDLSQRNPVLMCLAGHKHADMESAYGGVFHVITAADCLLNTAKVITPYGKKPEKKVKGTVTEQTVDYVSVSKDKTRITMLRIGNGEDRIFNLEPHVLKEGASLSVRPSLSGPVRWYVFDAPGGIPVKGETKGYRDYACTSTCASVATGGSVRGVSAGEAVLVATDKKGKKEYFLLQVQR